MKSIYKTDLLNRIKMTKEYLETLCNTPNTDKKEIALYEKDLLNLEKVRDEGRVMLNSEWKICCLWEEYDELDGKIEEKQEKIAEIKEKITEREFKDKDTTNLEERVEKLLEQIENIKERKEELESEISQLDGYVEGELQEKKPMLLIKVIDDQDDSDDEGNNEDTNNENKNNFEKPENCINIKNEMTEKEKNLKQELVTNQTSDDREEYYNEAINSLDPKDVSTEDKQENRFDERYFYWMREKCDEVKNLLISSIKGNAPREVSLEHFTTLEKFIDDLRQYFLEYSDFSEASCEEYYNNIPHLPNFNSLLELYSPACSNCGDMHEYEPDDEWDDYKFDRELSKMQCSFDIDKKLHSKAIEEKKYDQALTLRHRLIKKYFHIKQYVISEGGWDEDMVDKMLKKVPDVTREELLHNYEPHPWQKEFDEYKKAMDKKRNSDMVDLYAIRENEEEILHRRISNECGADYKIGWKKWCFLTASWLPLIGLGVGYSVCTHYDLKHQNEVLISHTKEIKESLEKKIDVAVKQVQWETQLGTTTIENKQKLILSKFDELDTSLKQIYSNQDKLSTNLEKVNSAIHKQWKEIEILFNSVSADIYHALESSPKLEDIRDKVTNIDLNLLEVVIAQDNPIMNWIKSWLS